MICSISLVHQFRYFFNFAYFILGETNICPLELEVHEAEFNGPIIPDAPEGGHGEDASDSADTESDDEDPDAERIRIAINKKVESAFVPSKRIKMVARQKMKETRGPPPESYSKGKRKADDEKDKDYTG
ncbi:hypothetical protein L1987_27498 [Smallanthus sonchifolius]|uniref:Uncharacterized protein n=1 Tax=Smallanthus sonchifolius TaxID=185202 RepID=A0ACB9IBB4_9ASTR|nr:hypothetical protein L1987_27498 [Smallanthus sonchifolius]